jgi:hypothetical protein
MKERPILMNREMVQATKELIKTHTRRINGLDKINIKPNMWKYSGVEADGIHHLFWFADGINTELVKCPYGKVGDRLWVRETFRPSEDPLSNSIFYRADEEYHKGAGWKPSIHMPRWASRLTLEIIDIRVERVQDISHRDALAEGVSYDVSKEGGAPVPRFHALWDSINASRGYSWDSNPWVWVIEFKVTS